MFNLLKSRRFRQGSVATAITAVVVALIVVFNMVITAVSDKFPLSLDLTTNKVFAISDDTKDFLASLGKDAEIFVLSSEESFTAGGEYFNQANEVIKKYSQMSPRVKVSYIDLLRNPNFAAKYPDLQLSPSSILVTCGDKVTTLTPYDLYNVEYDQYQGTQKITSSKAEQAMTSALMKVTSDKLVGVTFLAGHSESPMNGLRSLLEINNYTVIEQNLLTEEISPDSKIAVMCAPMRDLTDDELKKLDVFLRNGQKLGKTLFYIASNEQPELPKLAAFLADWGISVGESVVFESELSRALDLKGLMPVVDYTEDVYAQTVIERQLFTLMPYSRPLTMLFETKSSLTVTAPLEFSQTSGIMPVDAGDDWQTSDTQPSGPIPALVVSQNLSYEGTTPLRSNVVVCGSVMAFDDQYLSATSIGNGEFFLNTFNKLAEREDIVRIQPKTIGSSQLVIQGQQLLSLTIFFVILLPLAVLIFGIVIWLRRRHR